MAVGERDLVRVYEVNGLPSVELPYLHPRIPPGTLERIAEVEQRCLDEADAVVVPSPVIAAALRRRGVAPERLHVIPNGADMGGPTFRPPDAPDRYLLYFGALQPWQGLDTALRALARLSDLDDLHLVVCASVHRRKAKPYRKLAARLGVADRVHWRFALPEHELAPWREHALASLAPLRDCARNVAQGCAPLKVLESMASGVPVLASDLPVVRELMEDGGQGLLVPPDRPGELARAVRTLLDFPERSAAMGAAGRARVEDRFTWRAALAALDDLYAVLEPGWIGAVPEGSPT
jgi:glycosyltransferase involved in cell wall biosynthesis